MPIGFQSPVCGFGDEEQGLSEFASDWAALNLVDNNEGTVGEPEVETVAPPPIGPALSLRPAAYGDTETVSLQDCLDEAVQLFLDPSEVNASDVLRHMETDEDEDDLLMPAQATGSRSLLSSLPVFNEMYATKFHSTQANQQTGIFQLKREEEPQLHVASSATPTKAAMNNLTSSSLSSSSSSSSSLSSSIKSTSMQQLPPYISTVNTKDHFLASEMPVAGPSTSAVSFTQLNFIFIFERNET